MKTVKEWMVLWEQQFGAQPNNTLASFVEHIQRDALSSRDCGDAAALASVQVLLDAAKASAMEYRNKWLEARKYLRAANKGAERNAIALSLATERNIRYRQITEDFIKQLHEKSTKENSQESRQKETGEL